MVLCYSATLNSGEQSAGAAGEEVKTSVVDEDYVCAGVPRCGACAVAVAELAERCVASGY